MFFPYKDDIDFDVSLKFINSAVIPQPFIGSFFSNQKNAIIFDYLEWNRQIKNSFLDKEEIVRLLNYFFLFHRNIYFINFDESFYCSLSIIIHYLNIYNDMNALSLSIRIEIYKIFIHLFRFSRLSKYFLNLIFKTLNKFMIGSFEEDVLYSIQAISILSNYYLTKKFFKLLSSSNLQVLIKANNLSIIHSFCNILINMTRYPKTNSQQAHSLYFAIIQILSKYQNQAIISKLITIIFELTKNSLIFYQDFMLKIVYDESQNSQNSLLDLLQDRISYPKNINSNFDKNSISTIFRIFRRLINPNNIYNFRCIEDAFQYINSPNPNLQYYSFKFIYYYLKSFNQGTSPSSDLFNNMLFMLRNSEHQLISRVFIISTVEGFLKIKTLGFLVISELFKIPLLINDLMLFCDKIFIESLCSLFEIHNDFLLFDSISGILLYLIDFERKKENLNGNDSYFSNLIVQALSVDTLEYLIENSTSTNNTQQLLFILRRLNQLLLFSN